MAARKDDMQNPFDKSEPKGEREPKGEAKPVEGSDDVEVKLKSDDEDDDDDEGDEGESSSEPPRQTSRQRRSANYRELKEKSARLEAELERERAERRAFEARYAQPQPSGPSKSLDEQYKEALDGVYADQRRVANMHANLVAKGAFDKDAEEMLWKEHRDLETRKAAINNEYARLRAGGMQPQGPDPSQQAMMTWLQLEHSDVLTHPMGRAVLVAAQAEEVRLVHSGAPKDLETAKKAMNAAKLQFGLLKRPPPSATQRERYSGGVSAAGSSGASPGGNNGTMVLNKRQQQMAEALYPELPAGKAHVKWAQGPGQQMLKNRAASR